MAEVKEDKRSEMARGGRAGAGASPDAPRLRAEIEALDAQRRELDERLRAQVSDGSGETLGLSETSVATFDRDFVNGVFVGERASSIDRQLNILRRLVAIQTRGLALRGHDPWHEPGLGIGRIYLPSETDIRLPVSIAKQALMDVVAGRDVDLPSPAEKAERVPDSSRARVLTAVEAICLRRRQVIVGDPGIGKTSLLQFVAHALATRQRRLLPHWPQGEWGSVPVVLQLGDLSAWLVGQEDEGLSPVESIWGFLRHDFGERNLTFALDALMQTVAEGRALVLIDGLDEVPNELLDIVREGILALYRQAPRCRYVVTCRSLAYILPQWRLAESEFPVTRLQGLTQEQIDQFVTDWFAELSFAGRLFVADAERKSEALRAELKRGHPSRSASNPLALTLMALDFTNRGEVADSTARLYEQVVQLLLARMDREIEDGDVGRISDLLWAARRDRSDLIALFERLAARFQADWAEAAANGEDVSSGISDALLVSRIKPLHPGKDVGWAQAVVDVIKRHPGLLRERYPGAYYFAHRSIREYLAGCHLAHSAEFSERASDLVDARGSWYESILHGVGFIIHIQREPQRALDLVERLCPAEAAEDDEGWRRIWLAGVVMHEIGFSRAGDSANGIRLLERVRVRLAALVESGRLHPRERAEAAAYLARLGDPRFEPRGVRLAQRYRGEREKALGLVTMRRGQLTMGARDDSAGALPNELSNGVPLNLDYNFWIERYPVTVAQFRSFVRARGYERREWWSETGWAWCESAQRKSPEGWQEQRHNGNHPVVGVTWHEAVAYSLWLDDQLRKRRTKMPEGYRMRLPTEAEWEHAARCGEDRLYPWGDEPLEDRANVLGIIGTTTPVGLFPQGATPEGVLDLAGNVWEWTLSLDRTYPYDPADGRNNPDVDGKRILRGGSFDAEISRARVSARCGAPSRETARDIGFRLVLSPSDSAV